MKTAKSADKMSIPELEKSIRTHNQRYFVDKEPEISDYEFDQLVRTLERRAPDSKVLLEVGSDLTKGSRQKVAHSDPMLSLGKCYDEKSAMEWAFKFEGDIIGSPKIDGVALSLIYGNDGVLGVAATRGNGFVGENVTDNVRFVKNIPLKLSLSNVEVRGELYMPLSVFEGYREQFANPRNLAAGAIKQKDPRKTGAYNLSFFAYDLRHMNLETEFEKFQLLKREGFATVETKKISKEEIVALYREFLAYRDRFDYETDGVVFKANRVREQERLGVTAHHPRYAIAYKFQGDSGQTRLIDVEWNVARSGVITPVGIVEAVELSGAMVRRVSLHNYGLMKKLNITKGATVLMMRRGGVIPNLESVITAGNQPINIPTKCPSCGAPVGLRDDFLYCTNAKKCRNIAVSSLIHFVKVIKVDGLGEKLIQKLYDEKMVQEPADFFDLEVEDLLPLERMGEKLASKLVEEIQSRRKLPLDQFLHSLGIEGVGGRVAEVLAERFQTLNQLRSVGQEELIGIHSIGEVIARHVVDGLKNKESIIHHLTRYITITPHVKKQGKGPLSEKIFLFTATLSAMERKEASRRVEELGGDVVTVISKNVDFLVVGSEGRAGSKLTKAQKLQQEGEKIRIISEEEFMKMITS